MQKEFDFKKYQSHSYKWKTLLKIMAYMVVMFLLVYLILSKEKAPSENSNDASINNFDIEVTEPLSE
ncbi:MAG: hypothetical protein WC994_05740 [Brumimicrobium sp.]